mmetsp:Transcript_24476/g.53470  ORF Transcript_24476/g.53470 Transcript_24476/m.53470 type:complete len:215 (+) Transcript_24476:323-967(+)
MQRHTAATPPMSNPYDTMAHLIIRMMSFLVQQPAFPCRIATCRAWLSDADRHLSKGMRPATTLPPSWFDTYQAEYTSSHVPLHHSTTQGVDLALGKLSRAHQANQACLCQGPVPTQACFVGHSMGHNKGTCTQNKQLVAVGKCSDCVQSSTNQTYFILCSQDDESNNGTSSYPAAALANALRLQQTLWMGEPSSACQHATAGFVTWAQSHGGPA